MNEILMLSFRGLTLAAQDHVADQSRSGNLGHKGSDDSDSATRMERYGKWHGVCGENIGNIS
jgi:uncharacterized protein YkwD